MRFPRVILLRILAVLACSGAAAQAATVSLVPAGDEVIAGDAFTIQVFMEALDAPGNHPPGDFSGEIVIDFDPLLATYDGFSVTAPAVVSSGPTIGSENGNQTVTLKFDNATDFGVVGVFSFTASGPVGSLIDIGIRDSMPFFGTFVNRDPTNLPFRPEFAGTSVEIVPLPAAAWLLAGGLGFLGAFSRRR